MTIQPRKPAGSTEGGQYTATTGEEASPTELRLPLFVGSAGTVDAPNVTVINLEYLADHNADMPPTDDDLVQALTDAELLHRHGLTEDAAYVRRRIQERWGVTVTNRHRDEAHQRANELAHEPWALIEWGTVVAASPNVQPINMNVTETPNPSTNDVNEVLYLAQQAEALGHHREATDLRDWAASARTQLKHRS